MKSKKSAKKYAYENNINEPSSHLHELQEELRRTLELLQQHKLSSELEHQKRILIEQQYQQLKEDNLELRNEIEKIKKDLQKISKKYMKSKEQRQCQKCKHEEDNLREIEREREIFMKERGVLKNQIKQLKKNIQMMDDQSQVGKLELFIVQLKKELGFKGKTIEEQNKVIRFLDQKLSSFQLQNMKILTTVEAVDQKLEQLQMENNILKGFSEKNPNVRINGSIKNIEKSRSRISRDSY